MFTVVGLGLRALASHLRLAAMMALTIAVSLAAFLVLRGYQASLNERYAHLTETLLVVQQSGSLGEMYGSRLVPSLGGELLAGGARFAIPEIHTVVGLSPSDAVLLRGVSLDRYQDVEDFRMLAGRPLQPGDPPRLAMIGSRLAEDRSAAPGGMIQIRGREFQVCGIFEIGTFADYEAWVPLAGAQELMGWGEDVSIFVIPADGALSAGDELSGGISVVRKGDSGTNLAQEWRPLFNLLGLVAAALGAAAAVTLANILWRLAWLRRRELAILLSLGFGRRALTTYLLAQSGAVSLGGYLAGWAAALGLSRLTSVQTAGISIHALYDGRVLALSLLFILLISLAGSVLPVLWLVRANLAALLRADT